MNNRDERTPDLVELLDSPIGYKLAEGYNMINRDRWDVGGMPFVSTGISYLVGEEVKKKLKRRVSKFTVTEYQEEHC